MTRAVIEPAYLRTPTGGTLLPSHHGDRKEGKLYNKMTKDVWMCVGAYADVLSVSRVIARLGWDCSRVGGGGVGLCAI